MAKKKWRPTAEQIGNDPSLRYFPYYQGEAIWSDTHQAELRFYAYVGGGMVRLATLNGIAPLPPGQEVSEFSIRRLTAK